VTTAVVTQLFNGEFHVPPPASTTSLMSCRRSISSRRSRSRSRSFRTPALPTYTGNSTVHQSNFADSPNAGFANTITLHGTDGSHLLLHQNVHALVEANGIDVSVDNHHASWRG
jgi:hypothetical protein